MSADFHASPSAAELLDAVREFLLDEVVPATEGRLSFHARVAANVVAIVARELASGPADAAVHAERLAALGAADDDDLARRIAAGEYDDRLAEVRDALLADAHARVAVANPRWLAERD